MTASLASPPAFEYAMQGFSHSRRALALVVLTHVICALLLVKLIDTRRSELRPPLIVEILQPTPEIPEKPLPKRKPPEPKIEEPPPPPEKVPERPVLQTESPPKPLPQFEVPPLQEPAARVLPEPTYTPEQITIEPSRTPVPMVQARREPVPTPVATPMPTPAPVPLIESVAPLQESPIVPRLEPPREIVRDLPIEPIRLAQAPAMQTPTLLEPLRAIERDVAVPEVPRMTLREPPRQVRNEIPATGVMRAPPAPPTAPQPVRSLERDIRAPEAPRIAPREPPRRANYEMPAVEIAQAPLPALPAAVPQPQVVFLPEPPPGVGGDVAEEIEMGAAMLRANYLRNPKPGYPNLSRRLGEQGTVLLRVLVTAAGNSTQVELKHSSGYPRLDRAAHDAVRNWKFVPAKREEKAVDVWVVVPIKFSLSK